MEELGGVEGFVADPTLGASRRQLLTGGVVAGLAAAGAAVSVPTAAYSATAPQKTMRPPGAICAIEGSKNGPPTLSK